MSDLGRLTEFYRVGVDEGMSPAEAQVWAHEKVFGFAAAEALAERGRLLYVSVETWGAPHTSAEAITTPVSGPSDV